MLFTELRFFGFFLLVFAVHWGLRSTRGRKLWLLGASYAFYAGWDWRFLSLILTSTLVDYLAALRMGRPGARKRAWLFLSLGANLGLLGFFKYFNFFAESAADLITLFGFQPNRTTLEVVLPVGISFYTFQTLSYSLDVYFGRLAPRRSLLDVAVFVAFFPQLVAGPIVRAADFLPQLEAPRRIATVCFRPALVLFLSGYVKKACVSDNMATFIDSYFEHSHLFDTSAAWIGTGFYAIQIYCDFSGYSDMAIACAALLGYRIPLNFAFPYLAGNITEFWRRWHISLSSWLRDYLYIPLGGNRGSRLFTYRNLLLTMLLGGLWHGAAWNFVIWGGLHGLALVVHKEWTRRIPAGSFLRRGVGLLGPFLTLWYVCLCWVFFRAVGLDRALTIARSFFLLDGPGTREIEPWLLLAFPVLGAAHWIASRGRLAARFAALGPWAFAALWGGLLAVAQSFTSPGFQPFIYFQF